MKHEQRAALADLAANLRHQAGESGGAASAARELFVSLPRDLRAAVRRERVDGTLERRFAEACMRARNAIPGDATVSGVTLDAVVALLDWQAGLVGEMVLAYAERCGIDRARLEGRAEGIEEASDALDSSRMDESGKV